jgi:hypothetical protein
MDRDGGDAPVNSEWKQASNAPLPPHDWLNQEVEEVEGSKAELWTRFGGLQCDGEYNISDVKKQLKLDYEASSSINIK